MTVVRLLGAAILLCFAPLFLAVAAVALFACDLAWKIAGRGKASRSSPAEHSSAPQKATVVIPSWNARDLLEKYLPSVLEATRQNPENEVLVVDNGSDDGTADFLKTRFPEVRVLALPRNLGFGGGANAGIRAARNRTVVLLNNDMRVEPDFLAPLLEGFHDDSVFAVSCQILFTDPAKRRQETGLTEGAWSNGLLRVGHRIDEEVRDLYPCFYGGGGSCAFDRDKFLELGGFDSLLAPFYLEDTDLGFLAWKRGWKVFYQPRSVVYHEHRGTIGRRFSSAYIATVLKKNFLLFAWKNIHEPGRLAGHFLCAFADAAVSILLGDSPQRSNSIGIARAFLSLPAAVRSRWKAHSLAAISDTEAFLRPQGAYFRDRFGSTTIPERLRVLFMAPYALCPPNHGGAVFMEAAVRQLARRCDVHLLALLDFDRERVAHDELGRLCRSANFVVRNPGKPPSLGSLVPFAVREFAEPDAAWLLNRLVYTHNIDVLQLDYIMLAQYGGDFRNLACVLFEHDVYFQSLARALGEPHAWGWKTKAAFEYLRSLRYELRALKRFDRIQVCHADNRRYLASFAPDLAPRIQDGLRAGIHVPRYEFRTQGREADTMLFLGSFRHLPNQAALDWFLREILPRVVEARPKARLVIVGSEPPPTYHVPRSEHVDFRGHVDDIREPLARYATLVCPILSGSGVRVKILEGFAAGIPVVSTSIGAEGLPDKVCMRADDAARFARAILRLFEKPEEARELASRARAEVEKNWDIERTTVELVGSYREVLGKKRKNERRMHTDSHG